jgi:hypothetical protein
MFHGTRSPAIRAFLAFLVLVSALGIFSARAGLRGAGKYCGVVIFDRWDTCFLLSGPYITYISENVKDRLRPYQGQPMQVDASDVFQPMNPGDALIRKYEILGSAPDTHRWVTLDGLKLTAAADFGPRQTPTFLIEIHNLGGVPIEIDSSEIAPVLMGQNQEWVFEASDGASTAVITRADLMNSVSSARTVNGVTSSASYTIDPESRPPQHFQLEAGQSMKTRITFQVFPGQYQFMFGYGGGVHEEKSLASNAISFDTDGIGRAIFAK